MELIWQLGPPTCIAHWVLGPLNGSPYMHMKLNVGSRTAQQGSWQCPAPISPPDRQGRYPFITQVPVTRNNLNVKINPCYCLGLLDLVLALLPVALLALALACPTFGNYQVLGPCSPAHRSPYTTWTIPARSNATLDTTGTSARRRPPPVTVCLLLCFPYILYRGDWEVNSRKKNVIIKIHNYIIHHHITLLLGQK